eukprot:TRINITY_DN9513_c0_g1_i22.p1 TRINITY_DN9513_c0_g1~~TRINITY_DN9513_c0_g1_i22.p1  ORF type:complete len:682 (+),score=170.16 TRINITY_DN9513_c0_g1_i22:520-2565(+)
MSNLMPQVEREEVKVAALVALIDCIKFCDKNFKIEHEKDTIMTCVLSCCGSSSEEMRMKAMQCLLEVVRYFYDYISGKTLENIGVITFNDIRMDTAEEVALVALEIWCSICDEEIERLKAADAAKPCRDYIRTAYPGLLALLFESLKRKSENDENDWNISVAAACCLSLVAQIIKDTIADSVLYFISTNIGSAEWKAREAALLSFVSILKGPQRATILNIISQAINTLLALLKDPNVHVRETAAWTLSKITESNAEVFLDPNVLPNITESLLESLKDSPRVSNQICFVLHNLAEAAKPPEENTSGPLSIYFKNILDALWMNSFRADAFADGVNLANSSLATFANMIQFSAADAHTTLIQVFQLLGDEFARTLQPGYRVPDKASEYQGYLCSAMQPTFVKLSGRITAEDLGNLVELVLASFKQRVAVYDEGVLAMSGLIMASGRFFQPHMEKFGPYLVYALKNTEDVTLCRVAVGCVGDIARALEELVAGYLNQIMPVLMEILRNTETDRELKLIIITTLGDLGMATGGAFLPYLHDVLEMLKSAAQLSVELKANDDPDLVWYVQRLKESIIDAYVSLVYGVKVAQDTAIMDFYLPDIFKFIEYLCEGELDISQEFLKNIVGLIGDMGDLYGNRVKELLMQPFVKRVVGILDKATNRECKHVAAWTSNIIKKAIACLHNTFL